MPDRILLVESPALQKPTLLATQNKSTSPISVPHFDLPFRFVGSAAVVVEQDSLEDVVNCVEAALLTSRGQRKELPTFGVTDPTFRVQPIGVKDLVAQVSEHEPRAELTAQQDPLSFDILAANVTMRVSSSVDATEREVEADATVER